MKRVEVNPHTLLISVQDCLEMIEKDIITNANEVFARQEYYTHKYRGDLLNDVNVGIYLDDDLRYTIQVYVSNGHTALRSKLKLAQNLQRISTKEIINIKNMNITRTLPVYGELPFNARLEDLKAEILEAHPDFEITDIKIGYPKNDAYELFIELL